MSFQWVFDNAQSIGVNRRRIISQSITRNQTIRAVSRGNSVHRFTVQLPDGMRWSDIGSIIQTLDNLDRHTVQTVKIDHPGYNSWIHNGGFNASTTWNVMCMEMPEWTIFSRNQVSWSGPFVFIESRVV